MVYEYVPFLIKIVDFVMRIRTLVALVILTVFWDLVYKFLPNRAHMKKTTLRKQLPGAVFTAFGWQILSLYFCLPGYFYGIFKYVRQHDNNYTDYAVALRMYVYHFAWRRAERTAGENFV